MRFALCDSFSWTPPESSSIQAPLRLVAGRSECGASLKYSSQSRHSSASSAAVPSFAEIRRAIDLACRAIVERSESGPVVAARPPRASLRYWVIGGRNANRKARTGVCAREDPVSHKTVLHPCCHTSFSEISNDDPAQRTLNLLPLKFLKFYLSLTSTTRSTSATFPTLSRCAGAESSP
jgi:hypothetical protein